MKTEHRISPKTLRIAIISGIIIYGLFGYLDLLMLPSNYSTAWTIRYLIIPPTVIAIYLITYLTKLINKMLLAVQFIILTVGQLGIIALIWISNPQDIAFYAYYAGLILTLLWGCFIFRLNFKTALVFSGSTILLYNITAIFQQHMLFDPISSDAFIWYVGNNFFLISAAALSLVGVYRLDNDEKRMLKIRNELASDKDILEMSQQDLKDSEEKARIALNMSRDIILLCYPDGVVYDCNQAFCNIMNRTKDETVGTNHLDLFKAGVREEKKQILKRVCSTKKGVEVIDIHNNKFYQTNFIPIPDDNGNILKIAIYAHDITKRKRAEQALNESKEKLDESNKTKEKFLSIIGHDLKNPLSTIIGFSELLISNVDDNDPEKNKEFITHINKTANNSYKLLENLLLWSKAKSNNISYNPEKNNLMMLVSENVDLLNHTALKKLITIHTKVPSDIYVNADKNMILATLRNLISNAIKFTNTNGNVVVSAKKIDNYKDPPFIRVSVKDDGVGMAPEIMSNIFDISTNTTTAGTDNETGTGLGLILCNEFILKHNGKISIKSTQGVGSEFLFTLPVD